MALTKAELMESAASRVAWTGVVDGVGEVRVRDVTDDDYEYVLSRGASIAEKEMMARLVVVGLCDDTGGPLFTRKEAANVSRTFSFKAIKALSDLVLKHGGITLDDDEVDGSGNSPTTTPNGSGTD